MSAAVRQLSVLVILAIACGDDAPPQIAPSGIPLEDLPKALAEADCARLLACGAIPAPLDAITCVERQEQLVYGPLAQAIAAAGAAGTLDYFELAAKDCRSRVEALDCSVRLDHDVMLEPACTSMVTAKGGPGAVCPLAAACQTGLFCGGAACPGTCEAWRTNNETCDFGQPCADGLYCDLTARRCLAVAAAGQPCALSIGGNSCRTGSFCDQSSPAAPTCRPVRGRGQGCGGDDECIAGAQCVLARCSAGMVADGCEAQEDCVAGLFCVARSCVAPLALAEACTAVGPPCVDGAACDGASCLALPKSGEACGDLGCWLGRCVAGTCVAAALDQKACTASAECLPGRTCQGQLCTANYDCR